MYIKNNDVYIQAINHYHIVNDSTANIHIHDKGVDPWKFICFNCTKRIILVMAMCHIQVSLKYALIFLVTYMRGANFENVC